MSKFALLLCFLLVVNYSLCQESDPISKYYDYLVELLKGFSKNDQHLCSDFFALHRNDVIPIVQSGLAQIQAGESLASIALGLVGKIISIDSSVGSSCNLWGLIPLINTFNHEDEIKNIGKRISDKAGEIFTNIGLIKEAEGLNNKLVYIGRILSIVLNFFVY